MTEAASPFNLYWLVVVAVLTFFAARLLPRLFNHLSAPVARLDVRRTGIGWWVYFDIRGITMLGVLYFFMGMTYAMFGARAFVDLAVPLRLVPLPAGTLPPDTVLASVPQDVLVLGLAGGLLTCAVARVLCAYSSTFPSRALLLYSVGVIAYVAWYAPVFFRDIGVDSLSEKWDILYKSWAELAPYAILAAAMVAVAVEITIYGNEFAGVSSRSVPFSLVTARWEDHERVEQVFWAEGVEGRTNALIREVVRKEGPRDVCWLTTTAPRSHLTTLVEAANEWRGRRVSPANEVDRGLRVIIPAETEDEFLEKARGAGLRHLRVRCFERIPRLRLLILNQNLAVMHLPIPFGDWRGTVTAHDESNYAAIIRNPERINRLKAYFEFSWRQHCTWGLNKAVEELHRAGDDLGQQVARIVCGRRGGQFFTADDIVAGFAGYYPHAPIPPVPEVVERLRALVRERVIIEVPGGNGGNSEREQGDSESPGEGTEEATDATRYCGNPDAICCIPEWALVDAALGPSVPRDTYVPRRLADMLLRKASQLGEAGGLAGALAAIQEAEQLAGGIGDQELLAQAAALRAAYGLPPPP